MKNLSAISKLFSLAFLLLKNYVLKLKSFLVLLSGIFSFLLINHSYADAELNPNQIIGTISFSNENATIRDVLNRQGINSAHMKANSVGIDPVLNNSGTIRSDGGAQVSYQMTVESSSDGIAYDVSGELRMDSASERFMIKPKRSASVYPEPASDVTVNLEHCAAMVDVNFVDSDGGSVNVTGGYIIAWARENNRWNMQAQNFDLGSNTSQEYLLVNGDDSTYKMRIVYDFGSDPYVDKVRNSCQVEFTASCDQVIPVDCVTDGSEVAFGNIIGNLSVVGETLTDYSWLSNMRAIYGPYENYRYAEVEGAGPFNFQNLVPSDTVDPARGYYVYGMLGFGEDYDYQFLRTPRLKNVMVQANQTTDLGSTFEINPGYFSGNVELVGPASATSALQNLRRDVDSGYNYGRGSIPYNVHLSYSHMSAKGSSQLAEGATLDAGGGYARSIFSGSYNNETGVFDGNYRLAVGGLKSENSIWKFDRVALSFNNVRTRTEEEPYHNAMIWIMDEDIGYREIVATETHNYDHHYCLNEVQLAYKSLAGVFYKPRLQAQGQFVGENYRGELVNYRVSVNFAQGLPANKEAAADSGIVSLDLPQGDYTITPRVTAINPDGSETNTELPELTFDVGCGQVLVASTDIQVSVGDVPQKVEEDEITIEGSINSNAPVSSIHYVKNDNEPVNVCNSNCAPEGTFSATVPLDEGENQIVVTATADSGEQASVTVDVEYEAPVVLTPITLSQCSDISVQSGIADTAKVAFAPVATGGCSTPVVSCDSSSGSDFPKGVTKVSCSATDECEQAASCEFHVNVTSRFDNPHEVTLPEIAEAEPEPEPSSGNPIYESGEEFLQAHSLLLASMGIPQCASWNIKQEFPSKKCERDSRLPVLSSRNIVNVLLGKNAELVPVGHVVKVNHCDEDIESSLVTKVYSDEAEGSGQNSAKVGMQQKATADVSMGENGLSLRADTQADGDGRVYLIVNEVIDSSGETYTECSAVVVPSDDSQSSRVSVMSQSQKALAECRKSGGAPEEYYEQAQAEELAPERIERVQNKNNEFIDVLAFGAEDVFETVTVEETPTTPAGSGGTNNISISTTLDSNESSGSSSGSSGGGALEWPMLLLFTLLFAFREKFGRRKL